MIHPAAVRPFLSLLQTYLRQPKFFYSVWMDEEKRSLRHKLRNAEQENIVLKKMVRRAADEIEELAEAECSEDAVDNAKSQAKRLRKASSGRSA